MQRLIKRHLMNDGLVRLTPPLVARYNACLVSMGLEPTKLKTFMVDGAGVSPEIARERQDPFYLASGLANPFAIIISPEQYRKPVYFPAYSWMRGLMRLVFDKYHRAIIDTTGTHAIPIDLENGLSSFQGPEDLPLLTEVTAVFHVEDLIEASREQARLIAVFKDDLQCLDENVCDALVAHRQIHGDLRRRDVNMDELTFDLFADFYTVAFNGAAVLRNVDGADILILEDEEQFGLAFKNKKLKGTKVFHLNDPEYGFFGELMQANWLTVPMDRFKKQPKILEEKRDLLLSQALCDCEEGIDWTYISTAARKSLARKHEDKLPALFCELERFAAALKAGRKTDPSPELLHFLAEPSEKIPPATQEILRILLTHREPRNLLELYTVDKNAFLKRYISWGNERREWAANYLAARYVPRMSQK